MMKTYSLFIFSCISFYALCTKTPYSVKTSSIPASKCDYCGEIVGDRFAKQQHVNTFHKHEKEKASFQIMPTRSSLYRLFFSHETTSFYVSCKRCGILSCGFVCQECDISKPKEPAQAPLQGQIQQLIPATTLEQTTPPAQKEAVATKLAPAKSTVGAGKKVRSKKQNFPYSRLDNSSLKCNWCPGRTLIEKEQDMRAHIEECHYIKIRQRASELTHEQQLYGVICKNEANSESYYICNADNYVSMGAACKVCLNKQEAGRQGKQKDIMSMSNLLN